MSFAFKRTIKGICLSALFLGTSCQHENTISNRIKQDSVIEASYYSPQKFDIYPSSRPTAKDEERQEKIVTLDKLLSENEVSKENMQEKKSMWDDYAPKPFSIEAEHLEDLSYDIRNRIYRISGVKIDKNGEIILYEERDIRKSTRIGIDAFNAGSSLLYLEIKY